MKTILHSLSFVRAAGQALLVLAMAVPVAAVAQDAPAAPKIAVLDMTAALFNTEKAKELNTQVQGETAEDEAKVRSLAEQATALQEKLQKDAATLSDDEKRKTEEQIQEIGVQYQFLVQKLQNLVQQRRESFQQTYAPALIQAITEIVESEKYDIVVRSEAALYFLPAYDITAKVTEKLNQQQ